MKDLCRMSLALVFLASLPALAADYVPVDSVRGPMCVLRDTVTNVTFPLAPAHSQYNVLVTDGLAHITLTQKYVNTYGNIRDIVYVFPLPHDGSVHAMSMQYRDSVYTARIYETAEAQHIYDSVAAGGGSAALLLQTRPNVFQQRLANIAQGDSAWVRIELTMPLKYNDGMFELAVPTMVAERYQSSGAGSVPSAGPEMWNPPEDRDGQSLQINVLIQTGYPVAGLESPTHSLALSMVDESRALLEQRGVLSSGEELPMACNRVALLQQASTYPNRDFVLRFSRQSAGHDFSLASYYDASRGSGYFALNLYPDTALFSGNRQPLEVVLLMDVSGSQVGWPLAREKEIALDILGRLLPVDRLCVLSFSDGVYWCFGDSASRPASAANLDAARQYVSTRVTLGGTQLLAGVQAALASPATSENKRYYIFLTDGFITNETAILDAIRNHPSAPTVFTFGAGNSLNRYFLEQAAAVGNGYATEVTELEAVAPKVDAAWQKIESPQITNITFDFGTAGVSELIMPYGTNLYKGSPLVVYGRYTTGGLQHVVVRGYKAGQPLEIAKDIVFALGRNASRMLPQVWARQKIEQLSIAEGTTTANKQSIIFYSVEYQVLSKYTAFLAVNPQPVSGTNPPGGGGVPTATLVVQSMQRQFSLQAAAGMLRLALPTGSELLSFEVYDLAGRLVYRMRFDAAAGVWQLAWDGRQLDGKRLMAGKYVVRLATTRGQICRTITWSR